MTGTNKTDKLNAIVTILEQEKEKECRRLGFIKIAIEKKVVSVNRMIAYRNEYHNRDKKSLTNTVPTLLRNMNNFVDKINKAILSEKEKIETYEVEKIQCLNGISQLEAKISAIKSKVKDAVLKDKIKSENFKILEMEDWGAMTSKEKDYE